MFFSILNSLFIGFDILLNFGFRVYLAKLLPVSDLVIFFSAMDCILLFCLLFSGFKDALIKGVHEQGKVKGLFLLYWRKSLQLGVLLGLPFCLIAYNFIPNIEQLAIIDYFLVIFLYIANVLAFLVSFQLIALDKNFAASSFTLIKSAAYIVLTYVLYSFQSKVDYRLLIVIGCIVHFALGIFYLFVYRKQLFELPAKEISSDDQASLHKVTLVTAAEYILDAVYLYAGTVVVIKLLTLDTLASFQVVARPIFVSMLSVFSYPIMRFVFPQMIGFVRSKKLKEIETVKRNFYLYCLLLSTCLVSVTFLYSDVFVDFFFGVKYVESVNMIKVLVCAIPPAVASAFLFSIIKAHGYFKLITGIKLGSLFLSVVTFSVLYVFLDILPAVLWSMVMNHVAQFILGIFYYNKLNLTRALG